MQFLTLSRRKEGLTDDEYVACAAEEVRQAQLLYEEGFIRQIWHRTDAPGACILVEAASEELVRERLNTLPFVKAGMIEVSVIPLRPYSGFCPPA